MGIMTACRDLTHARSLSEIAADREMTNAQRAAEAMTVYSGGSVDDAMYGVAVAQVYALLAIADALTAPGSGLNAAEVIGAAAGIQV